jgi:hypothetical protein
MAVSSLVWLLVVVLLIAWLLGGFVFNVGNLIHFLLVLILIAIVYNLFMGRRAV